MKTFETSLGSLNEILRWVGISISRVVHKEDEVYYARGGHLLTTRLSVDLFVSPWSKTARGLLRFSFTLVGAEDFRERGLIVDDVPLATDKSADEVADA